MSFQGQMMLKLLDSLRLATIGPGADHPLASPREAAPIFAELRAGDPLKALEEITDWLQSIHAAEVLKPDRRYEIIRTLDDIAQPHRIKLAREYGTVSRHSRPHEARLWSLNHDFWSGAAEAYDGLITRFEQKEKGADALKKEAPMIAVRALRACGMRLKWLYVRYGPIPADIWVSLGHAYRFAEARGVQQTRIAPYPGIPGDTSPVEEFLRTLLLSASAPDALTPLELDVAERLIASLASKFRMTMQPNPDSTYWIDLANPRQPLRLAAPPSQLTPGLRFFATATGHVDVQGLLEKLEKTSELPRGVDLGSTSDPALVAEVLRHLVINWSPRPPVRRTERKRFQARVSVVHGFDAVVSVYRPTEFELDFDIGGAPASETWVVENMSNGGFGATVPQVGGDWLKIGALLAVQPDAGATHWDLAIVRRLSRDAEAMTPQASAGVQVLSRQALIGTFTTNVGRWANGVPTVDAIVVPDCGEAGAVIIVLPHGLYLPGEQLLAMIADQRHLLFPIAVVERGEDYDLIKFRDMVQDG